MLVYGQSVRVLWEVGIAESIFDDKFATGSRISVRL